MQIAPVRAGNIRPAQRLPVRPGSIGRSRAAAASLEQGGCVGRERSNPGEGLPIDRLSGIEHPRGKGAGCGIRRHAHPTDAGRAAIYRIVDDAGAQSKLIANSVLVHLNIIDKKRKCVGLPIDAITVRHADQAPNRNIDSATDAGIDLAGAARSAKESPVGIPGRITHKANALVIIRAEGCLEFERTSRRESGCVVVKTHSVRDELTIDN